MLKPTGEDNLLAKSSVISANTKVTTRAIQVFENHTAKCASGIRVLIQPSVTGLDELASLSEVRVQATTTQRVDDVLSHVEALVLPNPVDGVEELIHILGVELRVRVG